MFIYDLDLSDKSEYKYVHPNFFNDRKELGKKFPGMLLVKSNKYIKDYFDQSIFGDKEYTFPKLQFPLMLAHVYYEYHKKSICNEKDIEYKSNQINLRDQLYAADMFHNDEYFIHVCSLIYSSLSSNSIYSYIGNNNLLVEYATKMSYEHLDDDDKLFLLFMVYNKHQLKILDKSEHLIEFFLPNRNEIKNLLKKYIVMWLTIYNNKSIMSNFEEKIKMRIYKEEEEEEIFEIYNVQEQSTIRYYYGERKIMIDTSNDTEIPFFIPTSQTKFANNLFAKNLFFKMIGS